MRRRAGEITGAERTAEAATPGGGRGTLSPADLAELMAAFNDVTGKLERTHDQLRREVERLNRELSEANAQIERSRRLAALGEMAAGIAHEVRNPLGSIRLYARMLEQDLADRASERGLASKIAGAAASLNAVVGDVLRFASEFRLSREDVEAGELFRQALEACCHDGVEGWSGAKVEIDAGVEGLVFEADGGLLKQALVNVIRNGFEAMASTAPEARVLRLEAELARGEACGAVLRVRDSGTGIGPEVAGRIFNPFFTTRKTGTGLGLAIVHRILDAHGGTVVIRNNSEERRAACGAAGACVEMSIPGRRALAAGRTGIEVRVRPAAECAGAERAA